MVISDSGASGHFVLENALAVNKQVAVNAIAIKLPDEKLIYSTRTANLDIPWLPGNMTECHIEPGLTHSSSISAKKFCDAGYKVIFDKNYCRVYHKKGLVLHGGRYKLIRMWKLPGNPKSESLQPSKMGIPYQVPRRTNFFLTICTRCLISNNN